MLTDAEREALTAWYAREEILERCRKLHATGALEELEEYLHMTCLRPLGRHDDLPDFMRDDQGAPLFPTDLDPHKNLEQWKDAVEVAWDVMHRELGFTHDHVHRAVAEQQDRDWADFVRRAEIRKRESP